MKKLITLLRGQAHEAAESVMDRNALPLLRQQIRDCAGAIDTARKAVAIATAQNQQEAAQYKKLLVRIEELETRALSALAQDKAELAHQAAAAIARLETERDGYSQTQANFEAEISRLKQVILNAEQRLRDLRNGERIAAATDKTQRLRNSTPNIGLPTLKEAEATLMRLQNRQRQIDLTADALEDMGQLDDPTHVNEKLALAGCGAPIHTTADIVLARLTARANLLPAPDIKITTDQ